MEILKIIGKSILITIGIFVGIFIFAIPFALIISGYELVGFGILFFFVFFIILMIKLEKYIL